MARKEEGRGVARVPHKGRQARNASQNPYALLKSILRRPHTTKRQKKNTQPRKHIKKKGSKLRLKQTPPTHTHRSSTTLPTMPWPDRRARTRRRVWSMYSDPTFNEKRAEAYQEINLTKRKYAQRNLSTISEISKKKKIG